MNNKEVCGKMNMENESLSLCERVRFASLFDEPMDEEMKNHLCKCELCRTSLEQQNKITESLSIIKSDALIKNGKSVSASVMQEIENQSIFTGQRPVKSRFVFRYAGLVAACIIITVMALPMLDSILPGGKSSDLAVADEEYQYNTSEPQAESTNGANILADKMTNDGLSDGADVVTKGNFDFAEQEAPQESASGSAGAINSQNKVTSDKLQSSTAKDDTLKSETYLYSADMKEYSDIKDKVIMSPSEPAVEDTEDAVEEEICQEECDEAPAEQIVDPILYETALKAAKDYCTNNALDLKEMTDVEDRAGNTVCIVFETENSEQISVLLEKQQTGYTVLKVWSDK